MKRLFLFMILFAFLFSCQENTNSQETKRDNFAGISEYFDLSWAQNQHWDDGKAEVATYNATRKIYNKIRTFEYTYLAVSEDFNKEFNVKTDDYSRKDLYKVIKVNAFAKIETDNYPYHFLTSMFFLRNNALILNKMTNSSQEWCGNTFKEYLDTRRGLNLKYHSYWDGEGDGEKEIPTGTLLEDQLNYTLRALKFKEGLTFNAQVLESQISSKVGKLTIYNAQFNISNGAVANTSPSWKVTVKLDDEKTNQYYFAKAYPHVLLMQNTWDGRTLQLKKLSRYAYWQN